MEGAEPWRGDDAVIYQVYVRSFADSTGDGVGDLRGIIAKLPYLAQLGVDAVWLNPFYPSPQKDAGYDVSDYRDVEPLFGDLQDFDDLMGAAHGLGLRVIIDLVPNHTSSEHPWFRAALAAPPNSRERRGTCSGTDSASRANSRPTTGSRSSAGRRGRESVMASGTSTCLPRSSPTSTGPTRASSRSSTTS